MRLNRSGLLIFLLSWRASRDSLGVLDQLKVAKHGRGEIIYLVRFHYVGPRGKRMGEGKSG
jgi:hypothetical protein